MGFALLILYFVVVGAIQSLFLLMIVFKKRNGEFIHSTFIRIIGCILSAIAIIPLFIFFTLFI